MRYGRRFASCAVGVLLVGFAIVLAGRGKESRAQPGAATKPVERKAAVPPSFPPAADGLIPIDTPAGPMPPALGPDNPAPAAPEDPERAAETFIDQTKQQADAKIKELTLEAEQLRARLKKVETAIGRWQALRSALDQRPAEGQAVLAPGPQQLESAPADLPLPPPVESTPAPSPRPAKPPE